MKKISFLLISMFLIITINGQEEAIMTSPDVITSSTGIIDETMRSPLGFVQDGRDITATGTLKIPIVFVKFANDPVTTPHWPVDSLLPNWAANFVDSDIPINNIYQNNNLSKFYDLSSSGNGNGTLGEFQVIGDIYFVTLNYSRSYYDYYTREDQQVSKDVLDILDDPSGPFNVDFTNYDNWKFKDSAKAYSHIPSPDGILDFMLIYWKEKSISLASNVGGVAGLGFSGTISKDGINIASNNGVRGFKAQDFGLENTLWISAHEIGHFQFGMINGDVGSHFNGRVNGYGDMQRFALMTTGEGHQLSAYEKLRLGWLDPIVVTANQNNIVINDTHISPTNNAVIIPVEYNSSGYLKEYFLLENYHSTNAHSGANPFLTKSLFNHIISKGIIVYHVSEEDFDWPTLSQVDIEEAEGLFNWEVVQGGSTPYDRLDDLIAKGSENENTGYNERGAITATAGSIPYSDYLALTPSSSSKTVDKEKRRYDSDDWLGDQEDLFYSGYNEIFTKWSNPSSRKDNGSDSNVGFEIVSYNSSTHQYTINVAINSIGILPFAPSKPQDFNATFNNNIPNLTWATNGESDFDYYEIWKLSTPTGSWALLNTTSSTNYTDNSYEIGDGVVEYKIKAVDLSNKKSVYSNSDKITPPAIPQNLSITESPDEYSLLSWTANSEPDLKKYNVYRKGGYPFVDWAIIGDTVSNSYEDTEVTTTYRHGEDFFYKITAVDSSNNESSYSNEVEIEARLEKSINGEEDVVATETIEEYALNSNYPNPFNPTTQISYQIPEDSFVNLIVYNALGQEVAELVNQHQSVGKYSVKFNASNLPSGVYIYKLQANEFSAVKKMLLTK